MRDYKSTLYTILFMVVLFVIKFAINMFKGKVEYFNDDVKGNYNDPQNVKKAYNDLVTMGVISEKGSTETTGYVQNNNKKIEEFLCTVNPSFRSDVFVRWARNIIDTIARNGVGGNPFADKNMVFPENINIIYNGFLSNFTQTGDTDLLKVYFTASDKEVPVDQADKYFAVFKRFSCFSYATSGEVEGVSCPFCSGNIHFEEGKNTTICPYCGNTITMKENDWKLCAIEPVEGNIDNCPVYTEQGIY